MPKTFCPACLGYCRVHREQYGHKVVCPECRARFVATRPLRKRHNPVIIAIVVLFITAVGIYVHYKLTKYVPGTRPPIGQVSSYPLTIAGESGGSVIPWPVRGPN
jgi:hypothetical protein